MNINNNNSIVEVPTELQALHPEFAWFEKGKYYTSAGHIASLAEYDLTPPAAITALIDNAATIGVSGNDLFVFAEDTQIDVALLQPTEVFEIAAGNTPVTITIAGGLTIDGNASTTIDANVIAKFYKTLDGNIARIASEQPKAIVDSEGRKLSPHLLFEGGGINSSSANGWTKRFNGMTCTNQTGMMFETGAVIELIEFTCDEARTGRYFRIYHYDVNGRDGKLVFDQAIEAQDGQSLKEDGLSVYIPPQRRMAVYLAGQPCRYPQYRLGYRRIL